MAQNFIISNNDEWNIRTFRWFPPNLTCFDHKMAEDVEIYGCGSGWVRVVGIQGNITLAAALTYLIGEGFPRPPQHIIKEFIRLN